MGFEGNMEQLDAVADWETLTQYEGTLPPRQPRIVTSRCWVSQLRDGRYRVHWASSAGTRGVDGPWADLATAEKWCKHYEDNLGWKWVR